MKLEGYELKRINEYERDGMDLEDARIKHFGDVPHYVVVMKNGFDGYKARIMQEVDGAEGEWDNLYLGFLEKTEDGIIKLTEVQKSRRS